MPLKVIKTPKGLKDFSVLYDSEAKELFITIWSRMYIFWSKKRNGTNEANEATESSKS